ncbi:hypothetical protein [Sporolactobacillus sp. KGMB 08714]|uniref:hypothetical protein n=1 Tax=Sporolactobacillus sp. KGMB 08714 TaxID=3064704 RepID=UPI002FBEA684
MKDAERYFEKMNQRYGVHSVCGNSLGGALANVAGIHYASVKIVTLDPAILPADMFIHNKSYANITNFFTEYDILTHGEEAVNLQHRIPGKTIHLNSVVSSKFSNIISSSMKDTLINDHIGYDGGKDAARQY